VPTYRDGAGLWKQYDAMEVSSISGFVGEPAKVWDFERVFNDLLRDCKGPNAGHVALAGLEAAKCVDSVVTQNVDGFHQAAGSKNVIELHGSEVHAVCINSACGKRTEMARIFSQTEDLWSPNAKGWGIRWPEGPDDSQLQRTVRAQLVALQARGKKRKGTAKGSGSGSESSSGVSCASSSSSSSSGSDSSAPRRQRVPKPLSEAEKQHGPPVGRVPICPECREGLLKPDGIFFGEALVKSVLTQSLKLSMSCKAIVMVGTSGQVDPAAKLPLLARSKNKAKIIEVNIGETRLSRHADLRLVGSSAEVLPKLQKLVDTHPRTGQLKAQREAKLAQCEAISSTTSPSRNEVPASKSSENQPVVASNP